MQTNKSFNLKEKPKIFKVIQEQSAKYIFLICSIVSVFSIVTICIYLFATGFPTIAEIGFFKFLFGSVWKPSGDIYGILPMIVGSLYVTAGSLIVGVPLGLFSAAFITYFCPRKLKGTIKQVVSVLVGIPSIIYGLFGMIVIVPFAKELAYQLGISGASGSGVFSASVILGIMILPTIVNLSVASIEAVPKHYYEGALALGATHEQAAFKIVIPAAKSGIFTAVVLGMGRAIGETMAVLLVAGNSAVFPKSIFHSMETMTVAIVKEMGYATGLHQQALIAVGVVLFVFILILNISLNLFQQRRKIS